MRTETLTLRPYYRLPEHIFDALNDCAIRFSNDEEFDASAAQKVSIAPFEAQLELRVPDALLAHLGDLPSDDKWEWAVVLVDDSRRRSQLLQSTSVLSTLSSGVVSVPTSNLNLSWMGRKGGTISIYLALSCEIDQTLGLPSKRGHFASAKHFGINRTGPGEEFRVEFWPASEFESNGFSRQTTVVVSGDVGYLTETNPEDNGLIIAINERLRAAFAHSRRSRHANVLQDNIKSQAVAQLLIMAQDQEDLEPESVGYKMVRQVLKSVRKTPSNLREMTPSQVFEAAQVFCGLTESASKVL